MKQITAKQFLRWCCNDMEACSSILNISTNELNKFLEMPLDPMRSKLAIHLMKYEKKPNSKEDVLRIALARLELKLLSIQNMATSLAPMLEL